MLRGAMVRLAAVASCVPGVDGARAREAVRSAADAYASAKRIDADGDPMAGDVLMAMPSVPDADSAAEGGAA